MHALSEGGCLGLIKGRYYLAASSLCRCDEEMGLSKWECGCNPQGWREEMRETETERESLVGG